VTKDRSTLNSVKLKRLLAAIMICLLLFVVALSVFYVIEEAGHDCHEDHCPICAYIHQFHKATDNVALGFISATTVLSFVLFLCVISITVSANFSKGTLVEQKIRINC